MNCIIIDDETAARAIVGQLCTKVPELHILQEFDNAIEAIKFLNQQEVDVVFLDIHMPGFTGIDFERFEKCIQKVKKSLSKKPVSTAMVEPTSDLYINIDRRLIKLRLNEILVIEAEGDYIKVKTEKEEHRVHTTLKKIKEKLPDNLFLQIHRSYIINFTKIIDIEDNSVLIAKNVVPISRSNRPELMRRLNLL